MLEAAIYPYLDVTNQDPKPFVWTKPADQVLATIARFCQRTTETRHWAKAPPDQDKEIRHEARGTTYEQPGATAARPDRETSSVGQPLHHLLVQLDAEAGAVGHIHVAVFHLQGGLEDRPLVPD